MSTEAAGLREVVRECADRMEGSTLFDARLGVPAHLAGIFADDELKASGILEFACPTKGADGKWYRCTLAVTNVPVAELYNVLSGINFIAQRLREIGGVSVLVQAAELERLHELIKARDQRRIGATELRGQNVHADRHNPLHEDSPWRCKTCKWHGTREQAMTVRGLLACPRCQIPLGIEPVNPD